MVNTCNLTCNPLRGLEVGLEAHLQEVIVSHEPEEGCAYLGISAGLRTGLDGGSSTLQQVFSSPGWYLLHLRYTDSRAIAGAEVPKGGLISALCTWYVTLNRPLIGLYSLLLGPSLLALVQSRRLCKPPLPAQHTPGPR